jgi:hypothetical protein
MELVRRQGAELILDEIAFNFQAAGIAHQNAWIKLAIARWASQVCIYFILIHNLNLCYKIILIFLIVN